jgi:hypothetical protein
MGNGSVSDMVVVGTVAACEEKQFGVVEKREQVPLMRNLQFLLLVPGSKHTIRPR